MLSPRKYLQDCMSLLGEIIDHDAGYVFSEKQKGSEYACKRRQATLYECEHLQWCAPFYPPHRLLFDNKNATIHQVAREIVHQVARDFVNKMMDHDVGCG